MKLNYSSLLIVISLILLSLSGCREKGASFSFTTPEGEKVRLTVPPGFEDQRVAKPWKEVYPDNDLFKVKNSIASYIYRSGNSEKVIELYFTAREDPGTAKAWRREPKNRGLYDYTEYPGGNFICVPKIEYTDDSYIRSLKTHPDIDSYSANLYLQKQIFDIIMCYSEDSLITVKAKEMMNDIVKSIKIRKR